MWKLTRMLLESTALRSPPGEGNGAGSGEAGDDPGNAEALLDFDFSLEPEGQEGPKDDAAQAKPTKEAAPTEEGEEEPPAEEPSEKPEAKAGEDPKDALLAQQRNFIERLLKDQPATTKQEAAPPADDEPDFVKDYKKIGVPREIITRLQSEDPDEAAGTLSGIVQSLLIRAAQDTRKYVDEQLQRVRTEAPQLAAEQISQQEQARKIQEDFFGTYKQLDKPLLKPIVIQTMFNLGLELQQQGKPVNWDDGFKREVARRVVEGLGGKLQEAPVKPAPPARRQPFVAGGSNRPSTGKSLADDINDVLGIT